MPWPPEVEAFGHDERERFRITAARHVGRGGSRGLDTNRIPCDHDVGIAGAWLVVSKAITEWRSASDRERAGHRVTVMRGAQARWAPRDRRLLRVLELRRRLQRFLRRSGRTILPFSCLIAHRHRDLMSSDAEESADSDDRV